LSRTAVIVVVAALVAAVVVFVAWRPFAEDDTIRTRALGVWQESVDDQPTQMTVSSAAGGESENGGVEYWVSYPLVSDMPLPARLDGERIVVFDTEGQQALWSIVYDAGADALIVTQPAGGDSFVLRRVSE
jgi:hypothetical protein